MKASAQHTFDHITSQVRPEDEARIAASTEAKLTSVSKLHAASTLIHNIRLLFGMLRDSSFHLSWASRGIILGAFLYFVLPVDATPDFIPIIGYIDDTLIVGMVIKRLASEIERYKAHANRTT